MNTNFNPRRGQPFPSFVIVLSLAAVLLACLAATPTPPVPSAQTLSLDTNNVLRAQSTNFFQRNTGRLVAALSTAGITPGGGGPGGSATNAVATIKLDGSTVASGATVMSFISGAFAQWLLTNTAGVVSLQLNVTGLVSTATLATNTAALVAGTAVKADTNAPSIRAPAFDVSMTLNNVTQTNSGATRLREWTVITNGISDQKRWVKITDTNTIVWASVSDSGVENQYMSVRRYGQYVSEHQFNADSNLFGGDLFITGSIQDLDSLRGVGNFSMDGNGWFGDWVSFGAFTTNRSALLAEHYFATTNGGNGKKYFKLSARTNVFSIEAVYDSPGTGAPFVSFYKNPADGSPMFEWHQADSNLFSGALYFAAPGGSGGNMIRNPTTGKITLTDAPTIDAVNTTNLNASQLLSGTVPTARLGSGTANSSTFLRGDNTWATPGGGGTVTSVDATNNGNAGLFITTGPITGSGQFKIYPSNDLAAVEALTGTGFAKRTGTETWSLDTDVATTTALNNLSNSVPAGNLSGTVATARLGSGTANATTFLRGDQTWQSLLTNYIREVIFTNDTANKYTTNTSGITFWLATNLMAYGSGGGGTAGATNNQVLNGTTAFMGPATNQTIAVLTGNLMQGSNANWTLTTTSVGPLHFAASNFVENAWYLLTISNSVATSFGLITNGGGGQVQYRGWRGIDANSVTRVNMIKTYGVLTAYIDAAPGVTTIPYTGTNVVIDGTLAAFQRVILTNAAGVVVNVLVTNAVTDATTVQFHQGNVGNIQLSFISNAMTTRTNSSGLSLTTNAASLDTITFIPLTNGVVGANRIAAFQ